MCQGPVPGTAGMWGKGDRNPHLRRADILIGDRDNKNRVSSKVASAMWQQIQQVKRTGSGSGGSDLNRGVRMASRSR